MKKICACLLALVMVIGMVSCSSEPAENTNTPENASTPETAQTDEALSYEEVLEKAEQIELSNIYADADENALRAEQKYVGNTYRFAAYVAEIEKDHFTTPHSTNYGYYSATVNLANEEDLINLSTSNTYEIIGVVSSIADGTVVFDNAYVIDVDNYDFVLDGLYYCVTGSLDPSRYNLTVSEFLEKNPQLLEENLSEDDEIDLFVCATLNASNEDGADLYLPNTADNGELALELKIANNSYNTIFKMNDIDNRMSKFFDGYDDGYYSTENALKAGSGDSAEIVGLFSVEYGIYKEAIDTNAEITLSWGGKYTITANAKDIVKIDSVSDIAKSLNE